MFSASELHALITRCTWSTPVDPDSLWAEMRETVRARWSKALGELNVVYRALLTPQIGPGNPFPIPPPPPPTVAHGEWTGALVFERIAPKGLTNPVGYPAATPDEQAELDRMARAINRNTPLFEPTPQAPGSLDALRKTIVCAITNEKEAVNGQYGGADVGLLLNALVRMVDKAFADYAAQNAKAIERAAEPAKTLEPWTVDRLKLAFDERDILFDMEDDAAELVVGLIKNNASPTTPAKAPEPWTGETLYLAAEAKTKATFAVENWPELTNDNQVLWMLAASAANERMGSAPSPLKPWTGESFYAAYALAHERPCGWADLSAEGQSEWNRIAGIANKRMGIK